MLWRPIGCGFILLQKIVILEKEMMKKKKGWGGKETKKKGEKLNTRDHAYRIIGEKEGQLTHDRRYRVCGKERKAKDTKMR